MSETILITGAGPNGVTGRLLKEFFSKNYQVLSPGSRELDLTDDIAVECYFNNNKIDYVIHSATFRPSDTSSSYMVQDVFESNLRMYFALAKQSRKFKRMLYFGSGAEYGKTKPIVNVNECELGGGIPRDAYGFSKYIMNKHCCRTSNIYNFRLFGTINPFESYKKNVVSNLCVKAVFCQLLALRQDCRFSFINIADILSIMQRALSENLEFHDYNIAMTESFLLSDIAQIVREIAGIGTSISFEQPGLNREYTADNTRFVKEFSPQFTPIRDAISSVYNYWNDRKQDIDISEIDSRWKFKK